MSDFYCSGFQKMMYTIVINSSLLLIPPVQASPPHYNS